MSHDLDKTEGRRLATILDRALSVRCACGHEEVLAGRRLRMFLPAETRLKEVVPKLSCLECGKRAVSSWRIIDAEATGARD